MLKRLPMLVRIFLSVVLPMMAIVVGIWAIINQNLIHYTEDEISRTGLEKLKIAQSIAGKINDGILRDVYTLSASPYLNPDLVSSLARMSDMYSVKEKYDVIRMAQAISTIETNNPEIASVYLYVEDAGYVVSRKLGIEKTEKFEDTGWYEALKARPINSSPFWMPSRVPFNGKENGDELEVTYGRVLTYVYPLSSYTTQIRGAIIVNVDERAVSRQINGTEQAQGDVLMLSSDGRVVLHNRFTGMNAADKEAGTLYDLVSQKGNEGTLKRDADGIRELVTFRRTELNGWIFVGVFPLETLMTKVYDLQKRMVYLFSLALLVWLAVAYMISRKISNPVRQLISHIESNRGIDLKGERNELTILSGVFEHMLKEESQLAGLVERQRRDIRVSGLREIITGHVKADTEASGILQSFTEEGYCCVIVSIDRYADFLIKTEPERVQDYRILIAAAFQTVISTRFVCEAVLMENEKAAVLVNLSREAYGELPALILGQLEDIRTEITRALEISVSVSVGTYARKASEIHTSWQMALQLSRLKLILGHSSFAEPALLEQVERQAYNYPFTLEKHILNQMTAGSKEGILQSVSAFMEGVREANGLSTDTTYLMINQLIGSIVKYMIDAHVSVNDVFGEEYNIYQKLLDNETLDDVGLWIARICLHVMNYTGKSRTESGCYADRALEYIRRHFREDIDINALAADLGISYSHLRRVFLTETGENLLDYINNMRIEEAKRLLQQSDASLNDIAVSLGYHNDRSFSRFFKKYEGITPGEFRKLK